MVEILAPAGSFQALEAAVNYGADAVYVGGERFSARRSAQNFSDSELERAVDFCHARGAKLYVCCNTLMKETELSDAMDFLRYAYRIGTDAVIVQDLGLFTRLRRELPDFSLHASTQMTVASSSGINTLADMGAKRVVLAREVTGAELSEICHNTEVELEVFVHGALCISYSGQCLMSSILGGRSGNRGGCAQPCRLPYTLLQNGKPVTDTKAILCPKDLCLADKVAELARMGVASLKIEGRMKSPEYVAMVTQVYKQAATGSVSQDDIDKMLKFFSRGGSCSGYYHGCQFGDMMDMTGENKISSELPLLEKKKKTSGVSLFLEASLDKPLTLTMTTEQGRSVNTEGALCQRAHTKATDEERMKEQLRKLGDTPFHAETIEVITSGDVAIPAKDLNALRRQTAEKLETLICQGFKRSLPKSVPSPSVLKKSQASMELCVEVKTEEQLRGALDMGIRRIYLPESLKEHLPKIKEPVLMLPPMQSQGTKLDLGDFDKVCIQNIGQLSLAKGKTITAGHRLNVTNAETANFFKKQGAERVLVSPELNMKGIGALRAHTDLDLELFAYGRLPLMLMKNCVIKSAYDCRCDEGGFALLDRKNEVFPILPLHCGNVIYNSKPLYMADRIADIKNLQIEGLRLSFTLENYETCCIIIEEYQKALQGKTVKAPQGDFTRGHFYRGMQ